MNFFQTDFGLNFKNASQKFMANRKTLYPLHKCPRDWGRVEDQRKADDVM